MEQPLRHTCFVSDHVLLTTSVPRGNGQIERINSSIIAVLTKLCVETPQNWYRHLSTVQAALNGTYHRSIGKSPFEVLLGVQMRKAPEDNIIELLNQEAVDAFGSSRDKIRLQAKHQIQKVQDENTHNHNRNCKKPYTYQIGDLVYIKRTQFGVGLKIKPHFLGPYRVKKVNRNDRYFVEKVGDCEGPKETASSADNMKIWSPIETIVD